MRGSWGFGTGSLFIVTVFAALLLLGLVAGYFG